MMLLRKSYLGFFTIILAAMLTACVSVNTASVEAEPTANANTIFLVRHAEKQKGPDPSLTAAGETRADVLAAMLKDAGITHIHSSDYARTRQTAAPLADALGLSVELYDPRDLPAMAARLKTMTGTHLVVGHSNTTPQLTELLGGDGGTPIVEATEYDRLYLVVTGADGSVRSTLLRFGATSE